MAGNKIICFLVFFPFFGAVLTWIAGRGNRDKLRARLANGVTVLEFLVAAAWFCTMLVNPFKNDGCFISDRKLQLLLFLSGSFEWKSFCGLGLYFVPGRFRLLYVTVAALMWLMSTLYSEEYLARYKNKNRYYFFLLVTLGATMGVFLAADLFTAFIFFEIMSFTSYVWVAQDEKKESLRAAETYLAVAVIGGLVMLMGLFLLYHMAGTLMIWKLPTVCAGLQGPGLYVAGGCILFGFGAKAGMFPLHIWLPKAHPVAPAPASALLSGILTKAGIFGILVLSCHIFYGDGKWGLLILILGLLTMVVGAVLALFSINLKRVLACSSVSQIGFILTGIGMLGLLQEGSLVAGGTWPHMVNHFLGELQAGRRAMAGGTLLHMVNHSLLKLVLFMAAGVVYQNIHKLDLNEIRGFGHKKPLLHFVFLCGTLGISGIPLFNGYISKTLLHESIVEYSRVVGELGSFWTSMGMHLVEWVFLISGGITFAYMLKLYIALFWEKNRDHELQVEYDALKGRYMNKVSAFALTVPALLLPLLGAFPYKIADRLMDFGLDFLRTESTGQIAYFSFANLQGGFISIVIGVILYVGVVRFLLMKPVETPGDPVYYKLNDKYYVDRWPKRLDLEDRIYRPLLLRILPSAGTFCSRICDSLVDGLIVLLRKTVYKDSPLPHELEEGTQLTHVAGSLADAFGGLLNRSGLRKKKKKLQYEHKFALWHEMLTENHMIIGRSLSFGLLLALCGLLLTMIYVLLW